MAYSILFTLSHCRFHLVFSLNRLLKNDSPHRQIPVSRNYGLSNINEFLDKGIRRHDENRGVKTNFNSLLMTSVTVRY